jgi:methyl-accepting chemotaxis protein
MFTRNISIRIKLVLTSLSIAVVAVLCTAYFSIRATTSPLREVANENLKSIVDEFYTFVEANPDMEWAVIREMCNERLTIGKTGFIFVIDTEGNLLIHKKADSENWAAKPHIKQILERKNGSFRYISSMTNTYKIAAFRYFEEWDWVIVASAFEDEFLAAPRSAIIRYASIAGVIIVILAAIAISFYAVHITKPIRKVSAMVEDIAQGEADLTTRLNVNTKDEVGELSRWFNTFMDRLHDIIYQVKLNSESVASASAEISSATSQLASGAEEQTSQTSGMAASVQEMTAAIIENSQNANQTVNIAKQASEKAQEGSAAMHATQQGMEEIVVSATRTGDIVNSLSSRADQIGAIIQVIDDIADQTNLLALNAAIEAARAGEQGRGFAVVADEVRKLAERTTKATKEIAETIKAIQGDTKNASESMEEAHKVVNRGKEATVKTQEILGEIVKSVTQAMDMIQQIATASEQQSSTAEEISKSVDSISAVTSQSATGAEQMASATEQLTKQTEALKNIVAQFKLNDDGYDRTSTHRLVSEKAVAAHNGGLSEVLVSEAGQVTEAT